VTTNLDPNSRTARDHRDKMINEILNGAPVPPAVENAKPSGDPNIFCVKLIVGMDRGDPAVLTGYRATQALRFWKGHGLLMMLVTYGCCDDDVLRVEMLKHCASPEMARAIAIRQQPSWTEGRA
jgi:hypothetical protein